MTRITILQAHRIGRSVWLFLLAAGILCFCRPIHAQVAGPVPSDFIGSSSTSAGPDVNGFSGAFGYNLPLLTVPGPEGSGYTISMSYNSGASPNSEVSWVGYGWTLNAGSIVRNTQGLPDDWQGTLVRWNKVKRNWTVSATGKLNFESISQDLTGDNNDTTIGGAGIQSTLRYNSYTGFSHAAGINAFVTGKGGLGYAVDRGESSFSPSLDIGGILNPNRRPGPNRNSRFEPPWTLNEAAPLSTVLDALVAPKEVYYPLAAGTQYEGESVNYSAAFLASIPTIGIGYEFGVEGTHTYQDSRDSMHLPAYGYMYSGLAAEVPTAQMDYSVEKNVSYRKGDKLLPIPFSNADMYYRFGTNVGGGFRLYNRHTGIFRPGSVSSSFDIIQAGVDIIGVGRYGIGGRLGVGHHSHTEGEWEGGESPYSFAADGDEPYFFRMAGDRGGYSTLGPNDNAVQADLDFNLLDFDPSTFSNIWNPAIPPEVFPVVNYGPRNGRSTYIGFNTNDEMSATTDQGKLYRAYNKDIQSLAHVDRSREKIKGSIGEISIDDGNGYRYIYGLPLYARDEKKLSLGLPFLATDRPGQVHYNYLAHDTTTHDSAAYVQGEERAAPYVAAHLLTAITTPDYVDRTNDGPTVDDLGGYTRFTYRAPFNTAIKDSSNAFHWFHWRSPYTGFTFNRGELSDPSDDMGSFATGQREIYQLQTVETKTHVAVFVTNHTDLKLGQRSIKGSLTQRKDAYAPYWGKADRAIEALAAGDSTFTGAFYDGNGGWYNRQTKLERIELYTRDGNGNPDSLLQTVFLEHDYSLRPNMPNSVGVAADSLTRHGMLTLKKVWVQNQNVVHSRINPYEFGYEYRSSSDYPAAVRSKYPTITQFADSLSSAEQNPSYSPYDFDSWGNYQYQGASRLSRMRPWVNQVPNYNSFDPAAWQLKWIRTPSQSEIQVQYEQNDYSYVQNRQALGMVSLRRKFGSSLSSTDSESDNRYYLNLADLGIDTTSLSDVSKLKRRIQTEYVDANWKIYFRFLYALAGDTAHFHEADYNSEYISGYATVAHVGIDSVGGTYGLYLKLKEEGDEDIEVPKQVCLDYVEKRKRGKLQRNDPIAYRPNNAPKMIMELLWMQGSSIAYFNSADHCKDIDYENSYIRVPLIQPKKGGGIRVKRLLTLNSGAEGDSTLHGTEFLYDADDEQYHERTSSGVAINEPAAAREENALVDLVFTSDETRNKVIGGDDLNRLEGPRGESLLPGASVGYSRVVARSIYSGRTTPGFSIGEYFTARDYPFDYANRIPRHGAPWTKIEAQPIQFRPVWSPLAFIKLSIDNLWMTQGYRFIVNDMHGKPKSSSTYGGDYADRESWFLSASSTFNYYEPGEPIPVLDQIGDSIRLVNLGQSMETVVESREVSDVTMDGVVEGDATVFPIPPQYTGKGYASYNENRLRTHVTNRITHYPAFSKSVQTYADGQYSVARTLAFDRHSGSPLVSTTSDGYDKLGLDTATSRHRGQYHTIGVPAHSQFERMGQKALNERAIITTDTTVPGLRVSKSVAAGKHSLIFWSTDSTGKNEIGRLGAGDLVELTRSADGSHRGLYHVGTKSGNRIALLPVSTEIAGVNTDTGKVNVEVIRSGQTNQLGVSVGGIATYGLTDSIIQTGAYVSRIEPSGFADRLDLRDELRSRFAVGSGSIIASNLPAGLQLLDSSGACIALQDSIKISFLSGDRLRVSTNRGSDTLHYLDTSAHLELEDDGTLAFYASSDASVPQRLTKITFCPATTFVRYEVDGVLSAGASMLDDSAAYSLAGYGDSTANANSYETGRRGKWRGRSSYGYRTGLTAGSYYAQNQRVYRNAGLYNDFTLFNWKNPESNDSTKWVRGDTIIRFSPHGVPLETRSPLGMYSALRTGYDHHLVNYAAVNARYSAIGFEDFETLNSPDPDVRVVRGIAHTGNRSLLITSGAPHFPVVPSVTADPQIIANGVLINFWARFSRYGLDTTNCLAITTTTWGVVPMTAAHRIANSGEWTLYQVLLKTPTPTDGALLLFGINATLPDSSDTIWVDDIRVMPADAEMVCHVYDTETLRPMASLDGDHFAAFNQYNAEGGLVRTIVETARGVRTVAETHANLPGVSRTSGNPVDSLPPTETTILVSRKPVGEFVLDDERLDHASTTELAALTFDGLGAPEVKVLGSELAALEKAFDGNHLVLAERWLRIRNEYDSLSAALEETPEDPELQAKLEERLREIEKQQNRILRQLGISRKEMEALLEPQTSSSR